MEDLFAQFVDSDAVSQIISNTPIELQAYVLAIVALNEFPLPKSTFEFIDGKPYFHDLEIPFTAGLTDPREIDTNSDIVGQLAKIEGIRERLKVQHENNIQTYIGLFAPLRDLPLVKDMELIRQFSNADSLANGFAPIIAQSQSINMLPQYSQTAQSRLQSALACKMAGLTKPAEQLFNLVIQSQLIEQNVGYQTLLDELSNQIGAAKVAAKFAMKGNSKRHEKNRQRKEFALRLYRQKPYLNPKQATKNHYSKITKYAESIGCPFSISGDETVYRWFLEESKKEKN
ncbi:hypothetical protein L9G74_08325 [Shewanella sp. C32]|uniref:Uncharacterized protein n=1 Tax=Shewanella electrica TaxID=515560 RepID=A0ABT2FMK8_9GAMM|nr:hypothetical protein [Shewanella electrica]MCH1924540.1 hypothetical protein [Shewanella electrica]MCS4556441.1 hypothetical protein [Shewanella electrica]